MNKTVGETEDFAKAVREAAGSGSTAVFGGAEALICPPFTALEAARRSLRPLGVHLGAQNMHELESGAFTGEVSAPMLRELDCEYVILGHSERREHFLENDLRIAEKAAAALLAGLRPIVCVGERLTEREAGQTESVIERQMSAVLRRLSGDPALSGAAPALVVAYEPVWAIGSGRTASADDAQQVSRLVRNMVRGVLGETAAVGTRVLYGGSVKPENLAEFLEQPDIDGALVGGASLSPSSFVAMLEVAGRRGGE